MELDLAYRKLFGMIPTDAQMVELIRGYGVVDIEDIFGKLPKPQLSIDLQNVGMGCGFITRSKGKHSLNYQCASAHKRDYASLMTDIEQLIMDNNMIVVFVDLANMVAGNFENVKHNLDALPVSYLNKPVIYLVIYPRYELSPVEFNNNKIILPVTCKVPNTKGILNPCHGRNETDDILLLQLYYDLVQKQPDRAYVLSGDWYGWREELGFPITGLNNLKLTNTPTGLSPYTLTSMTPAMHISRASVFGAQGKETLINRSTTRKPTLFCSYMLTKGHCARGESCTFAHSRAELSDDTRSSLKKIPCKNGEGCTRKICSFTHPNQLPMP
jgi:hypothetical protein